jgi:CMP/dCMP kinase
MVYKLGGIIMMMSNTPLVITISHQFGSGGAYVGQKLSEKLNMLYLDREIIMSAAKKLGVLTEEIDNRDERTTTAKETLLNSFAYLDLTQISAFPNIDILSDKEIFQAESEVITSITKQRPSVVMGRCGFYILHDYPKHVSVFLSADIEFRSIRIQELFNISSIEAVKLIEKKDKERAQYIHRFTGKDIHDSRNYDLCIKTDIAGIDNTIDFICKYLKKRIE